MNKSMAKFNKKMEITGEKLCNIALGFKAEGSIVRRTSEKWKTVLTGKIWMI